MDPFEIPELLIRKRFDRRRVEGLSPAAYGQPRREFPNNRLSGTGGGRDENGGTAR